MVGVRKTLTLAEFEHWLKGNADAICVGPFYDIRVCNCGDVACKGWRLTAKPMLKPRERRS